MSIQNNNSNFYIILKNSQNKFIQKLVIKNELKQEGEDILPYIEEYIMKKRRVKYLAFVEYYPTYKDLFSLENEVKKFEFYNIKIQDYDELNVNIYSFVEKMY